MEIDKQVMPVSNICDFQHWFIINRTYQREDGIWSLNDKQHLIDTILKDFDIPKFYLRKLGEKNYEIVDGQQRIKTLSEFRNNKFKLSEEINGENYAGKIYKDLSEKDIFKIDNYQLDCVILEKSKDSDIRSIFRKLQRGKPLNWQEKINAYPGTIVAVSRSLANHIFFNKVTLSLTRYRALGVASRFLLLEKYGPTDINPRYIKDFFLVNKNMKESNNIVKNIKRVLNYLSTVFTEEEPMLNKESWIVNTYLLTSHLLKNYTMKGEEDRLKQFLISFWKSAEIVRRTGKGIPEMIQFANANTAGTNSKSRIEIRHKMLVEQFLSKNLDMKLLDPKRNFDHYEKRVIWWRDKGKCQWPGCKNKISWSDFHADHITPHSKGGPTTIENGQVLCAKHNLMKGSRA